MMTGYSRIPSFRNYVLGVMFFLLGSLSSSWAVVYHAGKYSVDIEVRNNTQMIIPDAKVDIWVGSKNITVEARSAGYLSGSVAIPIGQGTYYKRTINLKDPQKVFEAQDWQGGELSSVYFRYDQYGIAPNKYGVIVSIPEAVWPKATLKNVALYDAAWGVTFKFEGAIEQSDGFYHVKMIVSRKLLDWTGKQWIIVFDTRKPTGEATQNPQPKIVMKWLERMEASERMVGTQLPEEAEVLASSLYEHLDRGLVESLNISIPSALATRYALSDRFRQLHRDTD